MTYEQLLAALNPCREFPTLAERSKFQACNRNSTLVIITSSGSEYPIKRNIYNSVRERYENLNPDQRKISQNYTDTAWDQCPNRIQAPYLPAIWEYI